MYNPYRQYLCFLNMFYKTYSLVLVLDDIKFNDCHSIVVTRLYSYL